MPESLQARVAGRLPATGPGPDSQLPVRRRELLVASREVPPGPPGRSSRPASLDPGRADLAREGVQRANRSGRSLAEVGRDKQGLPQEQGGRRGQMARGGPAAPRIRKPPPVHRACWNRQNRKCGLGGLLEGRRGRLLCQRRPLAVWIAPRAVSATGPLDDRAHDLENTRVSRKHVLSRKGAGPPQVKGEGRSQSRRRAP